MKIVGHRITLSSKNRGGLSASQMVLGGDEYWWGYSQLVANLIRGWMEIVVMSGGGITGSGVMWARHRLVAVGDGA